MHSKLAEAMKVEAMQKTAEAIVAFGDRLERIEADVAEIKAFLKQYLPDLATARAKRG